MLEAREMMDRLYTRRDGLNSDLDKLRNIKNKAYAEGSCEQENDQIREILMVSELDWLDATIDCYINSLQS